jgi:hypothetical protein
VDAAHEVHYLAQHHAAIASLVGGLPGDLVGLQGVVRVVAHGGAQLLHAGGRLLQRGSLLLGAGERSWLPEAISLEALATDPATLRPCPTRVASLACMRSSESGNATISSCAWAPTVLERSPSAMLPAKGQGLMQRREDCRQQPQGHDHAGHEAKSQHGFPWQAKRTRDTADVESLAGSGLHPGRGGADLMRRGNRQSHGCLDPGSEGHRTRRSGRLAIDRGVQLARVLLLTQGFLDLGAVELPDLLAQQFGKFRRAHGLAFPLRR